ncbi:MAG: hypothetical protein KME17_08580 [Cyanosarcina radialis HA8281-LM2]|nr:hypothetical protein [Cyanosarcina radialis HA8281-LM2]
MIFRNLVEKIFCWGYVRYALRTGYANAIRPLQKLNSKAGFDAIGVKLTVKAFIRQGLKTPAS